MSVTLNTEQRQDKYWQAHVSISQAASQVANLSFAADPNDPQQGTVLMLVRSCEASLREAKRVLDACQQVEKLDVRMY